MKIVWESINRYEPLSRKAAAKDLISCSVCCPDEASSRPEGVCTLVCVSVCVCERVEGSVRVYM